MMADIAANGDNMTPDEVKRLLLEKMPQLPSQEPMRQVMAAIAKKPMKTIFHTNMEENSAEAFCKRLAAAVARFDATLDNDHEVGAKLVSFGETVIFHLTGLGYINPSLLVLTGVTDAGQPVELIQHVSQISVLLTKVKRLEPAKPKVPIGFAAFQA